MKLSEASERMLKGRVGLIIREPFFGTLAMRLELKEDLKCESTWTDSKRLGFNPERVLAASMEDLEGIWAHHVLTCALGHPFRRGTRDEKTWNEASDYAVNPEIVKVGFKLPEGSLVNPQFDGMHTEAIYASLRQGQPEDGQAPGGDSSAGGDGKGQAGSGRSLQASQGSAATGEVRDAPGGEGSEDEQPASAAEMEEQHADWQTAVTQAAQVARGCGKLPGGIERAIKEMLEPKVNWCEALQRLIRARSKDDYSWGKPNRRMLPFGLYLPSLDAPRCGVLAFAIDASGSIRQHHLDQFASEVFDAGQQLRPEKIIVMVFDTEVREVLEFQPGDPIILKARAGGGTRFDGPVRKLIEMEVEPEVLVYLTDLDSRVFPEEPNYEIIWVTTQPGTAPFGQIITMY